MLRWSTPVEIYRENFSVLVLRSAARALLHQVQLDLDHSIELPLLPLPRISLAQMRGSGFLVTSHAGWSGCNNYPAPPKEAGLLLMQCDPTPLLDFEGDQVLVRLRSVAGEGQSHLQLPS